MGPAPDLPAINASQKLSVSFPSGDTAPIPVTTTLIGSLLTYSRSLRDGYDATAIRRARSLRSTARGSRRGRVLLQVRHGVTDGLHLVGVLVGDVEAELLLERHHELDDVER